jgi:hypothetical protein
MRESMNVEKFKVLSSEIKSCLSVDRLKEVGRSKRVPLGEGGGDEGDGGLEKNRNT